MDAYDEMIRNMQGDGPPERPLTGREDAIQLVVDEILYHELSDDELVEVCNQVAERQGKKNCGIVNTAFEQGAEQGFGDGYDEGYDEGLRYGVQE